MYLLSMVIESNRYQVIPEAVAEDAETLKTHAECFTEQNEPIMWNFSDVTGLTRSQDFPCATWTWKWSISEVTHIAP